MENTNTSDNNNTANTIAAAKKRINPKANIAENMFAMHGKLPPQATDLEEAVLDEQFGV